MLKEKQVLNKNKVWLSHVLADTASMLSSVSLI